MGEKCCDRQCAISCNGDPTTADTATSPTTACTCNQGWDVHGDHCFFYSSDTKSWNDAEESCQEEGGHLASVNTNAIEGYVVDELKRRGIDFAWFGGNDIKEEGVWKWTDHTPWEFTFWGQGQPDNYHGQQHCLIWGWNGGKWDDESCSQKKPFVCSKSIC